eukprot:3855091-Amphidinium_carterae.2
MRCTAGSQAYTFLSPRRGDWSTPPPKLHECEVGPAAISSRCPVIQDILPHVPIDSIPDWGAPPNGRKEVSLYVAGFPGSLQTVPLLIEPLHSFVSA